MAHIHALNKKKVRKLDGRAVRVSGFWHTILTSHKEKNCNHAYSERRILTFYHTHCQIRVITHSQNLSNCSPSCTSTKNLTKKKKGPYFKLCRIFDGLHQEIQFLGSGLQRESGINYKPILILSFIKILLDINFFSLPSWRFLSVSGEWILYWM